MTSVMIDCLDAERLADFWSRLLGVDVCERHANFIWLEPQRPGAYALAFQEITDPTPGKNRIHLDGACSDLDDLTRTVEALGGSLVTTEEIPGFTWSVYADPEGNRFCFGHPLG